MNSYCRTWKKLKVLGACPAYQLLIPQIAHVLLWESIRNWTTSVTCKDLDTLTVNLITGRSKTRWAVKFKKGVSQIFLPSKTLNCHSEQIFTRQRQNKKFFPD